MRCWNVLLVGVAASIAGCSGGDDPWAAKRPAVVPADGVVTLQGKPVAGATVIFAPKTAGDEAYGASAITDSSGAFAAAAFPPDFGVVPGKYKVGVSKVEASQAERSPEEHDLPRGALERKHLIPERFSDPVTSGLTVEIPEAGKTDIEFKLQ